MQGSGETPEPTDFRPLEKFFRDIDFLVPGHERSSQYMVAIHREFYRWASHWVEGKTVLDAGCGEGYGSDLLAECAAHVVGIDMKTELVFHARRRYPRPNLHFEVMDCEAMTLADGSFDVVVSNELIEHLEDYGAFLDGAFRILAPGGLFLCATTNAELAFSEPDGAPMNRNHFQEFDATEFRCELELRYAQVRLYSQRMRGRSEKYVLNPRVRSLEWILVRLGVKHKIPIGWRNFVRERMTGVKVKDLIAEGFEIVEGAKADCLYLIGVARKS